MVCRVLQTLRSLVAMNESLRRQEQEFKAHCKVGDLGFRSCRLLASPSCRGIEESMTMSDSLK